MPNEPHRLLHRSRYLWILLLFILSILDPIAYSQGKIEKIHGRKAAAGEVLVKFRSVDAGALAGILAEQRFRDAKAIGGIRHLYRMRGGNKTVLELMRRLTTHPLVEYVEPNYVVQAVDTPNDPMFDQLWGLQNIGQLIGGIPGTAGADIDAVRAWGISTGSRANLVAVVDTGVDYTHPDLADNIWSAPAPFQLSIGGQFITCPAGSHGFNAITMTCDPMDDHYHGTHCAGTIGAIGDNSVGATGVNWTTQIIGAKFLDASGSGYTSDAINAIEFLVQAKSVAGANIRVVSNSWGGGGYSQALLDEINRANDMLFVFAAGNSAINIDTFPFYPASYAAPNLLAIAATDNNDRLASFSNYGATTVQLGAPGVDILSTTPGNQYEFLSGTSMATPHVAGAATLVLSKCNLDVAGLKADIVDNVDLTAALTGITVTGGRLNAYKALSACNGPVTLAPASLVFPRLLIGGTSTPQAVILTNNQSQPLAIASITATGDFAQINTCGGSVAGFSSCSIAVTFTPKSSGYLTGTVTVVDDATNSPQNVPLSGMGVSPMSLEPSALNFDSVVIGNSSSALASRVTNNTSTAAAISSITVSGDFAQSNDCPANLGSGASCTLSVTFTPMAVGDRTGSVTLIDDLGTQTLELAGMGVTLPDLVEGSVGAPATVGTGQVVHITDTVTNQGGSDAAPSYVRYYLSAGMSKSGAKLLSPSRFVPALSPDTSAPGSADVTIASNIAAGAYYFLACADDTNQVQESDETNNCAAVAVQVVGPDLVEGGITVSGPVGTGMAVQITDTVSNQGPGGAGGSYVRYYLSTSTSKSGARLLTGSRYVASVAAGGSASGSIAITLPTNLPLGAYYLLACADDLLAVPETNETNNCGAAAVQISGPDLIEDMVTVSGTVATGLTVQVTDTVSNQGVAAAGGSFVRYYVSTSTSKSGARLLTGSRYAASLAPGASATGSAAVTLPTNLSLGAYNLLACADDTLLTPESDESNNCAAVPVQVAGPDLVEGGLSVSGVVATGLPVQVSDTVANQGIGAAGNSVVRYYLATTVSKTGARLLTGSRYVGAVAPGAAAGGSTAVTIVTNIAPGAYYLLACADDLLAVPETDDNNNCAGIQVQVAVPDLVEGSVGVAGSMMPGGRVQVSDTVTNQGAGAAGGSFVRYYLSTGTSKTGAWLLTGSRYIASVAPGGSASGSVSVTVPRTVLAGSYNLLACADDLLAVPETNETNNCAAVPAQVTGP